MADWTPASWRSKPLKQEVLYEDQDGLQNAIQRLRKLPPLVTPHEIANLKQCLKRVAAGEAFVLQGGDCAELFDYCNQDMIEAKIKLMLQMSLILIWGANKPVIRVARIAGQFAKPRSSAVETVNGVTMPSFRGDNVNGFEATPGSRKPDPSRLVDAYFHSAATLNYIRAALSSGIADLHSPLDWGLGHVKTPAIKEKYEKITSSVTDSLRFMRTAGLDTARGIETADIYTSHEGLILEYEETLTRPSKGHVGSAAATQPAAQKDKEFYYDLSGHFLWIGDRTRQLDGGHVEFFRGISNPIGIKVGPTMQPDELVALLDVVNPDKELGKVTLISRYGGSKIADHLPAHIKAVQASGHTPIWQCDPMHGNTRSTPSGIKTRNFTDILSELRQALEIHRAHDSYLGGMHLELTGEAVTECVGGAGGLTEDGLSERYTTFCDPRLNEKQALELAFLVAGFYRDHATQAKVDDTAV
ncbi:phospho-2-dehydro-3-deoxyheptonate aldolase [Arthroderma uncinatum]|uniref:phospho-2-dehydro-3-deoxyheptonate aldolase n=1 Tax=Arthroderma uncinatum TaxID=74035 RepID=UPI00144ADD06|nr:phospho-2-dehydro-3-deoxyheptonate aldolase [Arthroderma uncinatum]KAF3480876.1 phospho-2-dehydro-3-deoxyheptonate aldolase [Arthroderma uncinatum]